jgi:hypothetical protein
VKRIRYPSQKNLRLRLYREYAGSTDIQPKYREKPCGATWLAWAKWTICSLLHATESPLSNKIRSLAYPFFGIFASGTGGGIGCFGWLLPCFGF